MAYLRFLPKYSFLYLQAFLLKKPLPVILQCLYVHRLFLHMYIEDPNVEGVTKLFALAKNLAINKKSTILVQSL